MRVFRRFLSQNSRKFVQVCLLGADTQVGQYLSFLLKQNPAVSVLHLQGTARVEAMCVDLSHFDTKSTAKVYFDYNSVSKSLKGADIVVMLGLNTSTSPMTLAKLVMAEAPRVASLAESCAKYAPKAVIICAVKPVSVTLPICAEVFRKTHWYHPARLLGSVALAQLKANSLAGHFQNLDPQMVHVPLIGGPDICCCIPLFTQTTPVGMTRRDADNLMDIFRDELKLPVVSQAYALNRMVTSVALGLCGYPHSAVSAYVRSNLIRTCQHLVSTVQMGRQGISHNWGLQKLSNRDLFMFENTVIELARREKMADEFVNRPDKNHLPAFMIRELELEQTLKQHVIR